MLKLNNMTKDEIKSLLDIRSAKYSEDENDPQVDTIRDEILAVIKGNFYSYEVDFILETLTRFGSAPNLVYDDNGMFAISDSGYQPVVTGDELIEGALTVFVEAVQWKKTIREALHYYLNDEG